MKNEASEFSNTITLDRVNAEIERLQKVLESNEPIPQETLMYEEMLRRGIYDIYSPANNIKP
jgi:hypothetical protein